MALACAQLDRRSPRTASYWLWMLAIAMGSTILAFVIANCFLPRGKAVTRDALGQDFLAFYSAGVFIDHGRSAELYDLSALATLQQSVANSAGFEPAADVAPWWNPPYVAWLFVPFAQLRFYPALIAWTIFSLSSLAGAAALLAKVIRSASERKRDWMLVPAMLLVAPPTIQSLGHGQNTSLSLLLLCITVGAWRVRKPLVTGLACAMLCYKPQLAAIVGLAAFATLGWRVAVGALLGLVPLLLLTLHAMPNALGEFIARVPINLHAIQTQQTYLWHRHVTFEGFFRFLFQGNAAGETRGWIQGLSLACLAGTIVALVYGWSTLRRVRIEQPGDEEFALDRFISLVILATPLSMPFFFDYDLLLLAVPFTLIAREMMLLPDRSSATRAFQFVGVATFVWLAFNPPMAEAFGLNLTVPLIAVLAGLQLKRCLSPIDAQEVDVGVSLEGTDQSVTKVAA